MKKKTVALLLACVMALGVAIGGTMAWLTAGTDPVQNTFTIGDIKIDLTETGTDTNGNKNYPFVPGDTLAKDPKVTVEAISEPCYLFIKVEEVNNTRTDLVGDIIQWGVQSGWTDCTTLAGSVGENIHYYYKVIENKTTTNTDHYILTDGQATPTNNQVKVNTGVTKEMRDEATTGIAAKEPKLIFDAAAVQIKNLADQGTAEQNLAAAWGQLPVDFKPTT